MHPPHLFQQHRDVRLVGGGGRGAEGVFDGVVRVAEPDAQGGKHAPAQSV